MSANPEDPTADTSRADAPRAGVSRTIVNFWLDASLLVTFLVLCWLSAVLQFVFPVGADATTSQIWAADVLDWRNAQFVVLCVLAAGILLHVMLHWSWIIGVITTRFLHRKAVRDNGSHTLIGVGLLLVIFHVLALACLAASMSMTVVPQ